MLRFLTAWIMISTTVVVFPVPGGPWTMATSLWHKANFTACLCESSRSRLKKTQEFSPSSVNGLICKGGPGGRFPNSTSIKWAAGPSLYLVKVSSALKVKMRQISPGQLTTVLQNAQIYVIINPVTPKSDFIDLTLSNARRFYLSKGDSLGVKALIKAFWLPIISKNVKAKFFCNWFIWGCFRIECSVSIHTCTNFGLKVPWDISKVNTFENVHEGEMEFPAGKGKREFNQTKKIPLKRSKDILRNKTFISL